MKKLTFLSLFLFSLPVVLQAQSASNTDSERTVLIEIFTSTTCPPCAPAGNTLQNWYNNYSNNERISIVKYPVWGPGAGCVFYHQNPQPVLQRNSFYNGIAGVPQGFVDGINAGHGPTNWINQAQNRINVDSPVRIDLSANIVGDEIIIDTYIENISGEALPSNVSLRVAVVERSISYSAPNGSTVQHHVHRNMTGGAWGTVVDIHETEYTHVQLVDEIKPHWDSEDLMVVAFLQLNGFGRMVYQSSKVSALRFPGMVSQQFPDNGEIGVQLNPELSWTSVNGSESYDVEISANSNLHNPHRITGITANSIELSELEESTDYYWRVRYWYDGYHSAWSDTRHFQTASTTSVNDPDQLPKLIKLHQNYPNPFNPTTNIVFELAEASAVLLEVYTIDGRKVATVLNKNMQPGIHQHTFDASDLSSGIYMYRLQAGSQIETKTMTLLK